MFFSNLKQNLQKGLINLPGWHTKRKIVVFESDDWGSIRMPNKDIYNKMLEKKLISVNDPFAKYDSLASEKDLEILFNLLAEFKDVNGNPPIFTANTIMTNPDFEKIRESNFKEYYYELFTETLRRYPEHSNSFDLWEKGISEKLFFPQLHGREHININRWLKNLKNGTEGFIDSFNYETFFVKPNMNLKKAVSIAPALDYDYEDDIIKIQENLKDGFYLFEKIFGYKSETFIAPNYIWDENTERTLNNLGIKILQSSKIQNIPEINSNKYSRKFRFTGYKNKFNQLFLIRNSYFEPSTIPHTEKLIDAVLKSISIAFSFSKPAIISTHRLNYIGFIDQKNRENNILLLRELLTKMLKKWDDIEFMTSSQLGNIIINE